MEFDSYQVQEEKEKLPPQKYHVEKEPKQNNSNSVRFCGCCITGPKNKAMMPIVSNCVILIALVANGLSLVYLWSSWAKFLTMANLVLGVMSLVLMWVVQCSDPGIQSRTKGKEVEVNNPEFNINDSQLSMNI